MDNNNQGFDYSGLYHNTNSGGANGQQPQGGNVSENYGAQNGAQQGAGQASYPNVGSSGLNTANTAPTSYGTSGSGTSQYPNGANQQPGGWNQNANGGYTDSFHGGNGGNGGGYSYASAPQQPPKKHKKGSGHKVLTRVVAGVCVVALGFGGGLAGVVVASKSGLIGGSSVVMQTVDRNTTTDSGTQGSASGTALSTQDVSSMVSPSVVVITTEQMVSSNTWFGGSYVESGAGSGVIMTADGYILTCAHVVSGASSIKVQLSGSTDSYDATVVGADSTADIAVIKVDATGLTPAVMGDSDKLAVGESVIAVGNPLGTLGGTVTNGIISAVNREITINGTSMTLIQTSASISPGNSGGGLFNANGELVGIVNAKSGASNAEGLGFAIPVNTAVSVSQELISNGYVKRPVLGVSVISITDAQTAMQYGVTEYGVYIAQVTKGSGAEAAGLQAGDRIVSIGDTVVSQSTDVTNYIQTQSVGATVAVQVERSGKLMSVNVTLGDNSTSASSDSGAASSETGSN